MSSKVTFTKRDGYHGFKWHAQITINGEDRPWNGFGATRREAAVDLAQALVFGVEMDRGTYIYDYEDDEPDAFDIAFAEGEPLALTSDEATRAHVDSRVRHAEAVVDEIRQLIAEAIA